MGEQADGRRKTPQERIRSLLLGALTLCVVAAAWLVLGRSPGGAAHGGSDGLVESRESLYNNIYVYKRGQYMSMTFGHNKRIYTESIYNTNDDRDLPVGYTRFLTASLIYPAQIRSVLEIGSGGARTSWYLHRYLPGVSITSVDLDPDVSALARQYFGVRDEPGFRLANRDGRTFLLDSKDHYDIIIIDAYRGPFVPFHLLTTEFYRLVKSHLAEGGVVAQNIEPSTMLFDAAVKTMQSVFPQVDLYHADGNVVAIAYGGAARGASDLQQAAARRQAEFNLRYPLPDLLAERRPLADEPNLIDAKAKIMTDDFAPVEELKAIQQHNRKWTGQ